MKQQLVLRALAKTKELVNGRPIIDRNKISTNNLRRLVLSANGLLQEHYVTGKGYNHLLDFKVFGDKELEGIYKDFENKRLNVADYKPMIDAVYKHHIYNNLEEILLLKSDYMHLGLHDEFELEKYGLDKFAKTYNLLKKSFARLSHISIAELDMVTLQQLYNDRKIIKDKPIAEQLKALGYNVELIVREIERLPNGNPAVFVRNTDTEKGYSIDEEYTGGEVKETQRLHKWFLDSQKAVLVAEVKQEPDMKNNNYAKPNNDQEYIKQLMQLKYKPINNSIEVAGNNGLHDKSINWLKGFDNEQPYSMDGYKKVTLLQNEAVLKNKFDNIGKLDIYDKAVYTVSEDTMFRVFVKEDDISFNLLIKLPIGLSEFNFNNPKIRNIAMMFSKTSGSETFNSSLMDIPKVKNLKSYLGVECSYDVVVVTLSKDLMQFKKSNWGLIDYIKASKNLEKNKFNAFGDLLLGSKIAVGVKPGALKYETFDCSGRYNVSGIIGGQAGSGKTAMFDSFMLQFLALGGDYGDGAVIMLDAKQEWIPAWRNVFKPLGIPLYGFDGSVLKNQESLKFESDSRGKKEIKNFSGQITQEIAGVIFVRTLYDIIQSIQKNACNAEDISIFNKSNVNFNGIQKLPRIAILVDELNTLYSFTDNPIVKTAYGLMTGGANLTRTSGYNWMLGGQNPSKTIIPTRDVGSLSYNIFGTMDAETYEYFGVTENKQVKEYEAKNSTPDNPHPIMSQGMFYAGKKGKTELVKCLYVDKSECC